MTAIEMHQVAEPYIRRRAIRHLEKGRICDFRGGHVQSVFFDRHRGHTARLWRSTPKSSPRPPRVDGVYDKDPHRSIPMPCVFTEIGYTEVLSKELRVMDASAVAMCRDNRLPIMVFNLNVAGNIMRMAMGEPIGTIIR